MVRSFMGTLLHRLSVVTMTQFRLFDWLALLFRQKPEILRPRPFIGKHETVGCKPAFKQLADRRRPAWHSPSEAPLVYGFQFELGQHDLQTLSAAKPQSETSAKL